MAKSDQPTGHYPALPVVRMAVLALVAVMLILAAFLIWPALIGRFKPESSQILPAQEQQATLQPSPSDTTTPTTALNSVIPAQEVEKPTDSPPAALSIDTQTAAFLSISEAGYAHLFAFLPDSLEMLRLTMGDWDDLAPAISPDGRWLAFSSNRSGQSDLYLMNLESGKVEQLTNTKEYESSPSWSPDGLWLAYEAYLAEGEGGNLEILIRPIDGSQPAIRLTDDPGADFGPSWSPGGRQIAYVSTATGDMEIWLSDLDKSEERNTNLSSEPDSNENHPTWSPDGSKLLWASKRVDGVERLYLWDTENPDLKATELETGNWPAWGPDGQSYLTTFVTPNQTYLIGYRLNDRQAIIPLMRMSGDVLGLSWGKGSISQSMVREFEPATQLTMPPLWLPRLHEDRIDPQGRVSMIELEGVRAPLPMLQDKADEAFLALRTRFADSAGWDFLSILENAYVPLTSPLEPGYIDDWLYTGRAIQVNSAPLRAGWMVMVKEDYGPETYWRLFLRTRYQDGSQGAPLHVLPFDPFARHTGDPIAYEKGGYQAKEIPPGYWVDFTRMAHEFGWERLPSLSTWRSSFSSLRFNEYHLPQGLDWFSAMLEAYPRIALNTSTPVLSPTPSATPTSTPTLTPTNTRTPYMSRTPTVTSTRRPTSPASPVPTKQPKE